MLPRLSAAVLVVAFAAAALWWRGCLRLNEPDPSRYAVRGIDVSHHQGKVEWSQAAGEGILFAYLKASEGGDHRDRRFLENASAAPRAGLAAGAYHFFTFCRDGQTQARNFLAVLEQAPGLSLPPAVDLEFVGNCARRPEPAELRAEIESFARRVEAETGRRLLYYVTTGFLRRYGDTVPPGARIWIRSVFVSPEWSYGKPWTLWQYADRGRVRGIAGPVDLNVFSGSREDWKAFLAPSPAATR